MNVAVVVLTSVAIAAGMIVRQRNQQRVRAADASAPRRTLGADGVIVGAEGFRLEGSTGRALLLLHGFNDTPQSVAKLARALHARGWTVSVPRLPHHGRSDHENARLGSADEWIACARTEWRAMCETVAANRAVLAGQSMGGAIAAIVAAELPPAALVLLAPYFEMGRLQRVLATVWPLTSLVIPIALSDPTRGLRDPAARAASLGRGQFTPRLLNQLRQVVNAARPTLRDLHAPTLFVQGRSDYRIPSASAQRSFNSIGATDKTLVWLTDVGHVIAADAGSTNVGAVVGDWLDTRVPTA